ncbi:MAG: hypothetical protein WC840_04770 [Candidatus Peribacteraceae bacterium]
MSDGPINPLHLPFELLLRPDKEIFNTNAAPQKVYCHETKGSDNEVEMECDTRPDSFELEVCSLTPDASYRKLLGPTGT